MRLRALFTLFLALAMTAALSAAPVLIDNFNTTQNLQAGPAPEDSNPLSVSSGVVTGANSLGGARFADVTRTAGTGQSRLNINSPAAGLLGFGNDESSDGQLLIWWDGDTDSTLDHSNFVSDLTGSGTNTGIRVFNRSDLIIGATLRVYTDAANYSTAQFNTAGGGTALPFTLVNLPFAAFVPTGAGATFTNITAVSLALTGPPSFDVQFDFIEATQTIPEPISAVLVGAALLGLGVYGRRRAAARK